MKINNISCTQFAGISNRDINFESGINVVYGKNETGKSTLVNLISSTLFQDTKLNQKSDAKFFNSFFPSSKKSDEETGDFIDGKIKFETEKGTYILSKEWDKNSANSKCTLTVPNGSVIRDNSKITDILKDALIYGEGVYSDMLLFSQCNMDTSLQNILDSSKVTNAKEDIISTVSKAFVESNGVSIDKIEQRISREIENIGKNWDIKNDGPMLTKRGTPKKSGLKDLCLCKKYYDMEAAKKNLEYILDLEKNVTKADEDYAKKYKSLKEAESELSDFRNIASKLEMKSSQEKILGNLKENKDKCLKALENWPIVSKNLKKSKSLKEELTNRTNTDIYENAKSLKEEIEEKKNSLSKVVPTQQDVENVKKCEREIAKLTNKLCGMNLSATIKMLGDNKIIIKNISDGKEIDITENMALTEAVEIIIPDVMKMQLSPADVDVADIKKKIDSKTQVMKNILNKYSVSSSEELEDLLEESKKIKGNIERDKDKLDNLLGNVDFDELENKVKSINKKPRKKEKIEDDISEICADKNIDNFIGKQENTIDSYEKDYGSIKALDKKISGIKEEISNKEKNVISVEDIPEKYRNISDPEKYEKDLENKCKELSENEGNAKEAKIIAERDLELELKKYENEDPKITAEIKTREFNEAKDLLKHWQNIHDAFMKLKEKINNNPMYDIAEHFTKYLGLISNGKVSSEFPEYDKLNMNIYSDDNLIDYSKLSEGTKETVSLAFRLAVLDHLFPDGDGIAVLDDPFANMDAERTEQSVKLIKEFSNRHQVIFLTCKEEYLETLGGNSIRI